MRVQEVLLTTVPVAPLIPVLVVHVMQVLVVHDIVALGAQLIKAREVRTIAGQVVPVMRVLEAMPTLVLVDLVIMALAALVTLAQVVGGIVRQSVDSVDEVIFMPNVKQFIPVVALLFSSNSLGVTLECHPLHHKHWQSNGIEKDAECATYSQKYPTSVGCLWFRVDLNLENSTAVMLLGDPQYGRLQTSSETYSFKVPNPMGNKEFVVNRATLEFRTKETLSIDFGGGVGLTSLTNERGKCVIVKDPGSENKI